MKTQRGEGSCMTVLFPSDMVTPTHGYHIPRACALLAYVILPACSHTWPPPRAAPSKKWRAYAPARCVACDTRRVAEPTLFASLCVNGLRSRGWRCAGCVNYVAVSI